jgi:hypothetical protein
MHLGLEHWWSSFGRVMKKIWYALEEIDRADASDLDKAIAKELMIGYDARWKDEPLEPIAVEMEFSIQLINPDTGAASKTWDQAGKLDVLARETTTGRVVIIEHKTSSDDISPGSHYWKMLNLDDQVSNYFTGAKSLGHTPEACIYDVIRKPKMRPLKATPVEDRKYTKAGKLYAAQREEDESLESFASRLQAAIAEAPHEWFQRGEIVRSEDEIKDAQADLWNIGKAIQASTVSGRHPRNIGSCRDYHRFCEFFGVCTKTESLDDPRLFMRVDSPHPELSIGHTDARAVNNQAEQEENR